MHVEGIVAAMRQLVPTYQLVGRGLLFLQQLRFPQVELWSEDVFEHPQAAETSNSLRLPDGAESSS